MPQSQPITETMILHLKEGVNLENLASGTDPSSSSPAFKAFVQLTETVKFQQGFMRQFWGHQVEDPTIFVWSIDWESFEHATALVNFDHRNTSMDRVFDLEAAAPITMYTHFTSDATAALAAPVTEVAFFTVPNGAREDAKTLIENDAIDNTHPVITVGKSLGGAVGWVSHTKHAGGAVSDGKSIALHGVFGYASVDDHIRWRETPEHAKVLEDMAQSPLFKLGLRNPRIPGGNIFVPDSSMFHVRFRGGCRKR